MQYEKASFCRHQSKFLFDLHVYLSECVCINYTQNKYIYIQHTHTHNRAPIFIAVVVVALSIECFLPKLSCVLSFTQMRYGPLCLLVVFFYKHAKLYKIYICIRLPVIISCKCLVNFSEFQRKKTERLKRYFVVSFNGQLSIKVTRD